MLRVWLDRRLPKLVHQLVREEIARISGTSR
jgi:cell pole-organizing protein PopZ